jgi:hypothetical protein
MKLYSRDGIEIAEILRLERQGTNLVLETRMMRVLVTSVCLRPEDVWKAIQLLFSKFVILFLPIILLKGMVAGLIGRNTDIVKSNLI